MAEYAAELYARELAPLLLFSGGMGRFTGEWAVPEAELFAEAAMKKGVPEDCILIENKSTNTGENVRFSRAVLEKAGIPEPSSIIALQKPYMERRTLGRVRAHLWTRKRWRHSARWWKRGMAPSCSRVSPFLGILEKTRFLLLLNADCGHQYNPHSQPNYITYHGRQNQHRPRPNGKNREPL